METTIDTFDGQVRHIHIATRETTKYKYRILYWRDNRGRTLYEFHKLLNIKNWNGPKWQLRVREIWEMRARGGQKIGWDDLGSYPFSS